MMTINELMADAWDQYRRGELELTRRAVTEALRSEPLLAEGLYLHGVVALDQNDSSEAIRSFQLAVGQQPDNAGYHHALGEAWRMFGRSEAAVASLNEALRLDPKLVAAHHALGLVWLDDGQHRKAADCFSQAIALRPEYQRAHNNLGRALQVQGDLNSAAASFTEAVRLKPDDALAHNNLGTVLQALGRSDAALVSLQNAVRLKPDYPEAHVNLGNTLQALGNFTAAEASFREAIRLRPDYAKARLQLGVVLESLGRLAEAMAIYESLVDLNPDLGDAWERLGLVLMISSQWDRARMAFEKSAACSREPEDLNSNLIYAKQMLCDWSQREQNLRSLGAWVDRQLAAVGKGGVTPFFSIVFAWPPSRQLAIAKAASRDLSAKQETLRLELAARPQTKPSGRLRVGYLSGDFYDHAVSHLAQGLFALHDRQKFEIFGYSFGPDDRSHYRQRIQRTCEHFIDVRDLRNSELARRIVADRIDILVDMMGFSGITRFEVMASRPAPVQVSWLSYPGTTGADFIDYVFGDHCVTPPESVADFCEQLVRLPHSYLITDHEQPVSNAAGRRQDHGLPDDGIVFASINNCYKFEPLIFDIWMRILNQVNGSVLWLKTGGGTMETNLRREAHVRGVSPDRIVFTRGILPKPDHLARLRLADLFLDTHFYNAHTTAVDALWVGLPVLTCPGKTFAARVGASLLNAIGLPELIASDLTAYEQLAVRLARQPHELQALRDKLAAHRTTWPLFDTPRFTKNLESAYRTMWDIHAAGQQPRGFEVQDEATV